MPTVNLFDSIVRFVSRRFEMNVKRLLFFSLVLMTIIGLFGATPRASAATCYTYKFTTFDNGMPQQLWAVDRFTSQVCITQTGPNTYQVVYNDNGSSFTTLSAKSPGGDGTTFVSAGVTGTISGGETLVIQGTLKSGIPSVVGPIDWRGHSRPIPYNEPFFSSITSSTVTAWGWTYKTCGNGTWVDNDATETLYGSVGPNATMGDIKGSPAACQNQQPAAQWFNPNDGRVDPQPGDRLAVWCNADGSIVVYGVNNDSEGFYLTTFNHKQTLAAGPKGIYHNLGKTGVVSINESPETYFWLAWNGGPYGNSAKGFQCRFSAQ